MLCSRATTLLTGTVLTVPIAKKLFAIKLIEKQPPPAYVTQTDSV